jgi:hypothetical protein
MHIVSYVLISKMVAITVQHLIDYGIQCQAEIDSCADTICCTFADVSGSISQQFWRTQRNSNHDLLHCHWSSRPSRKVNCCVWLKLFKHFMDYILLEPHSDHIWPWFSTSPFILLLAKLIPMCGCIMPPNLMAPHIGVEDGLPNLDGLMMSQHLVAPRRGHLEQVFHIFAYLKRFKWLTPIFYDTEPLFDKNRFVKCDWTEFYPGATKIICQSCGFQKRL